jgi:hypothetical protein
LPIVEKIGVFLKNRCCGQIFAKSRSNLRKKRQYFRQIFSAKIFLKSNRRSQIVDGEENKIVILALQILFTEQLKLSFICQNFFSERGIKKVFFGGAALGDNQGCQIFLGAIYQNGEKIRQAAAKCRKWPYHIPNNYKIYQIAKNFHNVPKLGILAFK